MKNKKKWKNGCRKKPMELISASKEVAQVCFFNEGVQVRKFVKQKPIEPLLAPREV
jgi:hypothetical protein